MDPHAETRGERGTLYLRASEKRIKRKALAKEDPQRKGTPPGFNAGDALGLPAHGSVSACPGWGGTMTLSRCRFPWGRKNTVQRQLGRWAPVFFGRPLLGLVTTVHGFEVRRKDLTAGRCSWTTLCTPAVP